MTKIKRALLFTRVSTSKQEQQRQIKQLNEACKKLDLKPFITLKEQVSGATRTKKRPVLLHALKMAKDGKYKVFMVTELSRLGRNARAILNAIDALHEEGINVYIDQFSLFTLQENGEKNFFANFFITMLSAFAELELETIRERVRSGQDYARSKGKHIGRRTGKESNEKFISKHQDIVKRINQGQSYSDIRKITGKAFSTISKVKKLI